MNEAKVAGKQQIYSFLQVDTIFSFYITYLSSSVLFIIQNLRFLDVILIRRLFGVDTNCTYRLVDMKYLES